MKITPTYSSVYGRTASDNLKANKKAFKILMKLSKDDLLCLAAMSGLDTNFYKKNKEFTVRGLMIALGHSIHSKF
jgi:hypothetical protein